MKRILIAIALSACLSQAALAQDTDAPEAQAAPPPAAPQMSPELMAEMAAWTAASTPGAEHKQLAEHFAGDWDVKTTMWMDPSMPPVNGTGSATAAAEFGGRHVRMKYTGDFMGQPFNGEAITSYDNTSGKYVNTWFDNMGTGQYVTRGEYDPDTSTYTFTGTMSDPTKAGKTTTMKDVIRMNDDGSYVMESYELEDGKEAKMMQLEYSRSSD